jgi:recombination associated protein RdgC
MWFKNLQVYRLTKPFDWQPEALAAELEKQAFKACGSQDVSSYGWVPPIAQYGTEYIHAANGYIMLCAKRQEKILPAGVINEQLEEKAQAIQAAEGRKPSRKERLAMKEEITFNLLPRAFAKSSKQYAYIAPKEGLIIVDSSSATRAEEMITALREALGSVPVIPLTAKNIPLQTMTHWLLNGDCPKGFEFGGECELKDLSEQGSVIRCKQQDLLSSEINAHIKNDMSVSKLHLIWQERIECIIDEKLGIKRLKYTDLVLDKADNENIDDAAQQFDVDFSIMTAELAGLITALTQAFGGEDLDNMDKLVEEKIIAAEAEPA